jgi:hypothetical protein
MVPCQSVFNIVYIKAIDCDLVVCATEGKDQREVLEGVL